MGLTGMRGIESPYRPGKAPRMPIVDSSDLALASRIRIGRFCDFNQTAMRHRILGPSFYQERLEAIQLKIAQVMMREKLDVEINGPIGVTALSESKSSSGGRLIHVLGFRIDCRDYYFRSPVIITKGSVKAGLEPQYFINPDLL